MTDYTELKRKIDEDYTLKRREEENFLLNHWKEFFSIKMSLETLVHEEFEKLINSLELIPASTGKNKSGKAKILNYFTSYKPENQSFEIKITKMELPDGRIMDDSKFITKVYGCPHMFTYRICGKNGEVHEKVKIFKEKYHIKSIKNVNHNCEHRKSIKKVEE